MKQASSSFVWMFGVLALVLARTAAAQAPTSREDVERLRAELQALREEYAGRLAAIEARLNALGAAAPVETPPAPAPTAAAVPPGAAGAGGPSGSLPVYGVATSKVFNPDIAVIGDFLGAAGKVTGAGEPSLEMHEAEAAFQAIVDPYARADFFFAFGPEGAEVEEGFLTFPTLPGGFLMKVGKVRTAFGKVDGMHNHVLPWTDRPQLTRNLLGGEEGLADAGVSLSRLIPNRVLFLEAIGEVYRGQSEVFTGSRRRDLTYVGHLRGYRDLSESSNLDLGGSIAYGSNDSEGTHAPGLHTRLLGVDATFRFRPLRRAIYRRLLARTELVWSQRGWAPGIHNDAFGVYASAEYQFARRWFAGVRWDRSGRLDDDLVDKGGSVLLTFWPSEFSQVRAQYRHIRFGEGQKANALLFQFLFSIGAHGAHAF
jgi:hypothetical protein